MRAPGWRPPRNDLRLPDKLCRTDACVDVGRETGCREDCMLAWMKDLTPRERRTMGACFGGWSLDAFDVQMYSFVIPTVIAQWGLSKGEAGLIGTVTLLISSLGGWFGWRGARLYGALCLFARSHSLARAVRRRTVAGCYGVLDPPAYRGTRDFRRRAARAPACWRGTFVRGVSRPAFVDDNQGLADGRGRAGRRLCARHLDADISAHRARAVGAEHRRLPDDADP